MSIRVSVCVCEREREREINESDFFTSIFGAANRERETGIKNINMFFQVIYFYHASVIMQQAHLYIHTVFFS